MDRAAFEKRYLQISYGRIAYLDVGSAAKPPVLFIHGIPTSSFLWRHVLRFLHNDFHCYAPDLMGLGDTDVDPESTPFDMDAQADMLVEFMSALGHQDFGLVCHNQGGAAAQIIAANYPQKVRCWVITDCVCYDNWPVPVIARHQKLAQVRFVSEFAGRSGLLEWFELRTPLGAFRRGMYRPDRLEDGTIREYLRPARAGGTAAERMRKFLLAGHPRYTLAAVDGLKRFFKPTLILWAGDDPYLSPSWGRRLLDDIPGAEQMEIIPCCGHFWQEERPAEFASLMGEFLAKHMEVIHDGRPYSVDHTNLSLPDAAGE
jgi:pimeloyl-ACP methyl ester carboxylesterase